MPKSSFEAFFGALGGAREGGGVGGDGGGRGARRSQHRHDEVVLQHRVAEGAASPMRLRGDPPSLSAARRNTLCLSADVQSVRK